MSQSQLEGRIIGLISDELDVPKSEISRDSLLVDDLKADSVDIVELVLKCENNFDIRVPDEDYHKLNTVGRIIDYITALK